MDSGSDASTIGKAGGHESAVRFEMEGVEFALPPSIHALAEASGTRMLDAHELSYLAACILRFDWSGHAFVLEIGCHMGRTTVFLATVRAHAGFDSPVLSVDPFERLHRPRTWWGLRRGRAGARGRYRRYVRNIEAAGVGHRCLPLSSLPWDAHWVVADRVGLLVIDGDHSYEAVASYLRSYAPKVLPGGFVFVDDYSEAYPGVMRAVDEFFAASTTFDIVHRSYFVLARRGS